MTQTQPGAGCSGRQAAERFQVASFARLAFSPMVDLQGELGFRLVPLGYDDAVAVNVAESVEGESPASEEIGDGGFEFIRGHIALLVSWGDFPDGPEAVSIPVQGISSAG